MTGGSLAAMVPARNSSVPWEERVMLEPTPMPQIELVEPEARDDEEVLVHEWRIEQLRSLGLTAAIAETFAGVVDWHDIAALVERGCTPELALEIVR
jgi:hypothetical protein